MADKVMIRKISDMDLSDEGEEVVFAEGVKSNVLDNDHAVGVRRGEEIRALHSFEGDVHRIARCHFFPCFQETCRRIAEAFATGIFPKFLEQTDDEILMFFAGDVFLFPGEFDPHSSWNPHNAMLLVSLSIERVRFLPVPLAVAILCCACIDDVVDETVCFLWLVDNVESGRLRGSEMRGDNGATFGDTIDQEFAFERLRHILQFSCEGRAALFESDLIDNASMGGFPTREILDHRGILPGNSKKESLSFWAEGEILKEEAKNPARHGDCGEHGEEDAEAERNGKAANDGGADHEEDDTGDNGGDVTVPNGGPGPLEAGFYCGGEKLALSEFFLDAFENEDICINGHPNPAARAGDTFKGKDDILAREEAEGKL